MLVEPTFHRMKGWNDAESDAGIVEAGPCSFPFPFFFFLKFPFGILSFEFLYPVWTLIRNQLERGSLS